MKFRVRVVLAMAGHETTRIVKEEVVDTAYMNHAIGLLMMRLCAMEVYREHEWRLKEVTCEHVDGTEE